MDRFTTRPPGSGRPGQIGEIKSDQNFNNLIRRNHNKFDAGKQQEKQEILLYVWQDVIIEVKLAKNRSVNNSEQLTLSAVKKNMFLHDDVYGYPGNF